MIRALATVAVLVTLVTARTARADDECDYTASYSSPVGWEGVCAAAEQVPLGCPIPYVIPQDLEASVMSQVIVSRGSGIVTTGITATEMVVGSTTASFEAVDVYSCDWRALHRDRGVRSSGRARSRASRSAMTSRS